MKVIVIDTEKNAPQIVETKGGLDEWKRLLKCSLIDIATMNIAGVSYDFIVDTEALNKPGGKVTAISSSKEPLLVGNLVICNYNQEEGTEVTLTDADIKHIIDNLVILTEDTTREDPARWIAVNNVS